jgi:hypothetical protein
MAATDKKAAAVPVRRGSGGKRRRRGAGARAPRGRGTLRVSDLAEMSPETAWQTSTSGASQGT